MDDVQDAAGQVEGEKGVLIRARGWGMGLGAKN
jgi:hypothetical protein